MKLTRSLRLVQLQEFLAHKTPAGGATLTEIMEKCQVSERQVYRDLDTLEGELDIRVLRPDKGLKNSGRYSLDQAFNLKIGPESAAILFLSILRQKGSPLAPGINETKDIVLAALFQNRYKGSIKAIEKLQSRVHVVEEQLLDAPKSGEVLLRIMQALQDDKVVNIKYYTASKGLWSTRDVEPYGLTSKHNNWYLVGYCRKTEKTRTFRIDCIDQVRVVNSYFVYPADFSLTQYFGGSWGVFSDDEPQRIVIRVKPELAYRFKLLAYHPSQKLEAEYEDGSVEVSYETSGLYEFVGWLLQWGELVEVLEPQAVREMVKAKVKRLVEQYGV